MKRPNAKVLPFFPFRKSVIMILLGFLIIIIIILSEFWPKQKKEIDSRVTNHTYLQKWTVTDYQTRFFFFNFIWIGIWNLLSLPTNNKS